MTVRLLSEFDPHRDHTITAETRMVEPVAGIETYEPTGEFSCSCGVTWKQDEPIPPPPGSGR